MAVAVRTEKSVRPVASRVASANVARVAGPMAQLARRRRRVVGPDWTSCEVPTSHWPWGWACPAARLAKGWCHWMPAERHPTPWLRHPLTSRIPCPAGCLRRRRCGLSFPLPHQPTPRARRLPWRRRPQHQRQRKSPLWPTRYRRRVDQDPIRVEVPLIPSGSLRASSTNTSSARPSGERPPPSMLPRWRGPPKPTSWRRGRP